MVEKEANLSVCCVSQSKIASAEVDVETSQPKNCSGGDDVFASVRVGRTTIVTAAFIVAYILAISINSFVFDDIGDELTYYPNMHGQVSPSSSSFLDRMFCGGNRQPMFCRPMPKNIQQ